jgi:geranylgeranyl diphosphate synthase type II
VDLRGFVAECATRVDRRLGELVPEASRSPAELHAAMRHLLFPGGKRLRPALAMAGAQAVGASLDAALPVAAAVELIHTYSLIHDDLPCMDDDDERRGRPTVHVAYGEATAVLAGDALLALAFQAAAEAASECGAERAALAVRDLAVASGSLGLVGGQVDDLQYDPEDREAAHVESVHERKSAALIAASVVGGARLAGASEEQLTQLDRFGRAVGVAFQIADDLLDDGEDDPCSLVRAQGVEEARARAEFLLDGALGLVEDWGERAEPLRELARFVVRRDR